MIGPSNQIAVLVPNYNGATFIAHTLSKINACFPDYTTIVVDDCSNDESIGIIEKSGFKVLKRDMNGGFAAAINTGLSYLIDNGFDIAIVANSDIEIDHYSAELVRDSLQSLTNDSTIMVLGYCESSCIRCGDGEDISGFLFSLRLSIIKEIGYFDESFYMYGEEQDYFRRITDSGYRIQQTNIKIKHRKEGSGGGSLSSSWLAMRNALYLEAKRRLWRKMFHVYLVLFLTINRIYRPHGYQQDPSYQRIIRPGIIKGNILLIRALAWNLNNLISNRKDHD